MIVGGVPGLSYPDPGAVEIVASPTEWILAASDAAIVKSGTITLEAALSGVPMVVAYRVHPVTGWLARRLLEVHWISLVNLLAGLSLVPEFLQGEATPDRLSQAVRPLLAPAGQEARAQREGFGRIKTMLGGSGAARRVAGIAAELLGHP